MGSGVEAIADGTGRLDGETGAVLCPDSTPVAGTFDTDPLGIGDPGPTSMPPETSSVPTLVQSPPPAARSDSVVRIQVRRPPRAAVGPPDGPQKGHSARTVPQGR
mmetsp:Transcript_16103/g.56105  ORF Transcript_16103/g.56105 Transcript_16103/m.56105 type:complete len:105 (+) Transcript_16103:2871-3185(+)